MHRTRLDLFQSIFTYLNERPVDTQLQYTLSKRFPISSLQIQQIRAWCLSEIEAGRIRMRGPQTLRYANLLHQNASPFQIRIDIVDMNGVGPGHVHPLGEINLCFALSHTEKGRASFDGLSEGWVVKQPGSWHRPTVRNGRMLIIYFLPKGKVLFD